MTKRQTHPKNGSETVAPEPDGEQAPDQPSTDHKSEAEEDSSQESSDASIREDGGASDALMESYNG
ncbi:MAG: hypothetical protein V3U32_02130 [Anaerolineales bacterium]